MSGGTCGKVRYPSRINALLTLARIRHDDDPRRPKTERRAYRCPTCHGWHLTSMGARTR